MKLNEKWEGRVFMEEERRGREVNRENERRMWMRRRNERRKREERRLCRRKKKRRGEMIFRFRRSRHKYGNHKNVIMHLLHFTNVANIMLFTTYLRCITMGFRTIGCCNGGLLAMFVTPISALVQQMRGDNTA